MNNQVSDSGDGVFCSEILLPALGVILLTIAFFLVGITSVYLAAFGATLIFIPVLHLFYATITKRHRS